ncbi:MAG: hypothetical protein WD065_12065, partial [Planctomycetaceae bacterium]
MARIPHQEDSMSRFAITSFALALSLLCDSLLCFSQAPEKKPVPKFEGTELPTPPQQTAEWEIPETTLPQNLLEATEQLFAQGLADPRGCEYREIEIVAAWHRGRGEVVASHGWVLPSEKREGQRFAVCWNGLVYPVISMGEKADVRAEAQAWIDAHRERREKHLAENSGRPYKIGFGYLDERSAVMHTTWWGAPRVCLLLRLGEYDLAQRYWQIWEDHYDNVNDNRHHIFDPYFYFATNWLLGMYNRAVSAHQRGDHHLSLIVFEDLLNVIDDVKASARLRGFDEKMNGGVNRRLEFFLPAGVLADEQRRRLKEEPYETARKKGFDTFKTNDALIKALIRDLEKVGEEPVSDFFMGEPTIAGLVNLGADSVAPLIECVAEDMRLTQYFRDDGPLAFPHRKYFAVDELAYEALEQILETRELPRPYFNPSIGLVERLNRKQQAADAIRTYWDTIKDKPLAQSWYDMLADDSETAEHWVEAAHHIARPLSHWSGKPWLRGETLRGLYTPGVSELLAKRVQQLMPTEDVSVSTKVTRLLRASDMALDFGKWDRRASLPTLRTVMLECTNSFSAMVEADTAARRFGRLIAQLTMQRVEASDEAALHEYAVWIRNVTPDQIGDTAVLRDSLDPLWKHPNHPAIADVSEFLFNDESSAWNPVIHAEPKPDGVAVFGMFHTHRPMIRNPAFRMQVLRGLTDTSEAGHTLTIDLHKYEIHIDMGVDHNGRVPRRDDVLYPAAGTKASFRICDLYAWSLRDANSPPIALYWPEAERDKAVAACIEFVKNYKVEEE